MQTETAVVEWRGVRTDPSRPGFDLRVGAVPMLLVADRDAAHLALAAVAGFAAHRGEVLIDGRPVTDLPAHRRRVALIGPELGLPPRGRVAAIVARDARGGPALEAALADTGLSMQADWPIGRLDPGERLRLEIARAVAAHPRLIAIDGALDPLPPAMADAALGALAAVRGHLDCAVVIATARPMALVGRPLGGEAQIAAIVAGRVAQVGAAQEIYDDPATIAVAGLLGPTNLLHARLLDRHEDGAGRCALADDTVVEAMVTAIAPVDGRPCRIDVRPERIALAHGTELAGEGGLIGQIEAVSPEGAWTSVTVRLRADGAAMLVRRPAGSPLGRIVVGAEVSLAWQPHHARIWPV